MKRLLIFLALACGYADAQNGVNSGQWFVMDGTYWAPKPYCVLATQAKASGGVLTLTASSGTFKCQGQTASFGVSALMSSPFSFTYGRVIWTARMATTGVHTTLWLWGGAPGTSGYPPTCIAALRLAGNFMGACTADASKAYEIDMAELEPLATGLSIINNNTHIWVNAVDTASSAQQYNAGVDLTMATHTYELDWSAGSLIFKLDGTTTNTLSPAAGTFDQPMFLLINVAVDGMSSTGSYPITAQAQSVQVFDPNNNLIFSDVFPGTPGFFFGIP